MQSSPHKDPTVLRFDLPYRREDVERAQRTVLNAIKQHGYSRESLFAVRIAIEEALTNAFKHGNKQDVNKTVRLEARVDAEVVHIDIEDEGEGFDPHSIPDPTEEENLEIPCGRGLKLMRSFMSEVQIQPPGNRVRMRYERPRE